MAAPQPDDADVQRIRAANPIEQIVGSYVRLRPDRPSRLKASCPFHPDQFASLYVAPADDGGRYHCFDCMDGGDVFDFVMRVEHLNRADAVRHLAKRAGMESPKGD